MILVMYLSVTVYSLCHCALFTAYFLCYCALYVTFSRPTGPDADRDSGRPSTGSNLFHLAPRRFSIDARDQTSGRQIERRASAGVRQFYRHVAKDGHFLVLR